MSTCEARDRTLWFMAPYNSFKKTPPLGGDELNLICHSPLEEKPHSLERGECHKIGKVKLDSESIDFAWVTLRESKKYDLIGGIYEELKMADYALRGKDPQKVKL